VIWLGGLCAGDGVRVPGELMSSCWASTCVLPNPTQKYHPQSCPILGQHAHMTAAPPAAQRHVRSATTAPPGCAGHVAAAAGGGLGRMGHARAHTQPGPVAGAGRAWRGGGGVGVLPLLRATGASAGGVGHMSCAKTLAAVFPLARISGWPSPPLVASKRMM